MVSMEEILSRIATRYKQALGLPVNAPEMNAQQK